MILLAFSPAASEVHTTSNSPGSTFSPFAGSAAEISYLVRSDQRDITVESSVLMMGDNVSITTSFLVPGNNLSTCSAVSCSFPNVTINSLGLYAGSCYSSFGSPAGVGNWTLEKSVTGNEEGLVLYASVMAKNDALGVNKTISVTLESVSLSHGLDFEAIEPTDVFLLFIPQLISPSDISSTSGVNPAMHSAPSGCSGNCLRLTELDNHLTNYHVWHLETCLNAWSPTYGGYQASYEAKATSPLDNWWLKCAGLSTSVAVGYQVEACAKAFFYGVFFGVTSNIWCGYPKVIVTSYFTNSGFITSGNIIDPIYNFPIKWSCSKVSISSFCGYEDVQEYIIA